MDWDIESRRFGRKAWVVREQTSGACAGLEVGTSCLFEEPEVGKHHGRRWNAFRHRSTIEGVQRMEKSIRIFPDNPL